MLCNGMKKRKKRSTYYTNILLILFTRFIAIFFIVKTFPGCASYFGLSALFWIHSGICILICIVAIIILPETKGKTLTELSQLYADNPKKGPI